LFKEKFARNVASNIGKKSLTLCINIEKKSTNLILADALADFPLQKAAFSITYDLSEKFQTGDEHVANILCCGS